MSQSILSYIRRSLLTRRFSQFLIRKSEFESRITFGWVSTPWRGFAPAEHHELVVTVAWCVLAAGERRGGEGDTGHSPAGAGETWSLPDQRSEQRRSQRGESDHPTSRSFVGQSAWQLGSVRQRSAWLLALRPQRPYRQADNTLCSEKKHPLVFSCITLRKSGQFEWKFQTK